MDLNTSSDAITDFSEIVEEDMDFIEETYSQQSLTDMIISFILLYITVPSRIKP